MAAVPRTRAVVVVNDTVPDFLDIAGADVSLQLAAQQPPKRFFFDSVILRHEVQQFLSTTCEEIVHQALLGVSTTLVVLGCRGVGKTHVTTGANGIAERLLSEYFRTAGADRQLLLSVYEVYDDTVVDHFAPEDSFESLVAAPSIVSVRVASLQQGLELLTQARAMSNNYSEAPTLPIPSSSTFLVRLALIDSAQVVTAACLVVDPVDDGTQDQLLAAVECLSAGREPAATPIGSHLGPFLRGTRSIFVDLVASDGAVLSKVDRILTITHDARAGLAARLGCPGLSLSTIVPVCSVLAPNMAPAPAPGSLLTPKRSNAPMSGAVESSVCVPPQVDPVGRSTVVHDKPAHAPARECFGTPAHASDDGDNDGGSGSDCADDAAASLHVDMLQPAATEPETPAPPPRDGRGDTAPSQTGVQAFRDLRRRYQQAVLALQKADEYRTMLQTRVATLDSESQEMLLKSDLHLLNAQKRAANIRTIIADSESASLFDLQQILFAHEEDLQALTDQYHEAIRDAAGGLMRRALDYVDAAPGQPGQPGRPGGGARHAQTRALVRELERATGERLAAEEKLRDAQRRDRAATAKTLLFRDLERQHASMRRDCEERIRERRGLEEAVRTAAAAREAARRELDGSQRRSAQAQATLRELQLDLGTLKMALSHLREEGAGGAEGTGRAEGAEGAGLAKTFSPSPSRTPARPRAADLRQCEGLVQRVLASIAQRKRMHGLTREEIDLELDMLNVQEFVARAMGEGGPPPPGPPGAQRAQGWASGPADGLDPAASAPLTAANVNRVVYKPVRRVLAEAESLERCVEERLHRLLADKGV